MCIVYAAGPGTPTHMISAIDEGKAFHPTLVTVTIIIIIIILFLFYV